MSSVTVSDASFPALNLYPVYEIGIQDDGVLKEHLKRVIEVLDTGKYTMDLYPVHA